MTQWYVAKTGNDGNAGTSGSPFLTIQHASTVTQPGDTVHVGAGTYDQAVDSPNTFVYINGYNGSAGNPITYISDTPLAAKVTAPGGGGVPCAWYVFADYIIIQGFDITCTGTGANAGDGILMSGNHTTVQNCYVHDCQESGIDHANDYSLIDNNVVGNIVARCGDGSNQNHGIYMARNTGTVFNNIIYGSNGGFGIQLWHFADNIKVCNNLLFNNSYGITMGSDNVAPVSNVINNNIIINSTGTATAWAIDESGLCGPGNTYANNVIFGTNPGAFGPTALASGDTITGTISSDPQLAFYIADGTGNYRLAKGSRCIGAGTSTGAPSLDFDGNTRPSQGGYDIGPYQYSPRWGKF